VLNQLSTTQLTRNELSMNFSKHFYRTSFAILILAVIFDSCTDQRLTTPPAPGASPKVDVATSGSISSTQTSFNKAVGAPINSQTGLRWIKNFASTKSSFIDAEYFVYGSTLQKIVADNNCVGISLYYAIDGSGKLHIIPVGIDGNGNIIVSQTVNVENMDISWQTAWQWINSYSGKVISHFFGAQTFTRLLIDQKLQTVRISLAMDDSNNPQLLLSNASNPNPSYYDDESRPCPPYCPGI